ncbi:MAG: hypothetical protein ACTSQQ_05520 [Candidatus Helarchaeota archaeon]
MATVPTTTMTMTIIQIQKFDPPSGGNRTPKEMSVPPTLMMKVE